MDSVAGDEQAPVRHDALPAGRALKKSRADTAAGLGVESCKLATEVEPPLPRRCSGLQQQEMKCSAMDGNLRPAVAGGETPRLAPDALAAFGEIGKLAARHAGLLNGRAQPQFLQFPHGVGEHVDAHAQRLNLGHGLEHLNGESGVVQAQGGGKTADSGAGNYDFVAGWHSRVAIPGVRTVTQRIERIHAAVPERLSRELRSMQGAARQTT